MRYFLIFSTFLFVLQACSNEEAPQDTETNKYYADYLALHSAYDSLGNEATLVLLNEYLEEYPERKEAYVFKGYILGKMGEFKKADLVFEEAKMKDSANVEIYEYQGAFLLYDTTQYNKANQVINNGLALNDSSVSLYNSLAWLLLFDENYSEAIEVIKTGLAINSAYTNLYRPAFIAAYNLKDEEATAYYDSILVSNNIETTEILNTLKNGNAYTVYKNIQ